MTSYRILLPFLAMQCSLSATVYSFPEQQGIVVKFVGPDEQTPLVYTKGVNIMQDFKHGYMTTANYFHKKGLYPVGIIIHNKSNEVVKISAASIGSQQRSVKDIIAHCLKFECPIGLNISIGTGLCWIGILQGARGVADDVMFLLFLLAINGACIAGGFLVDFYLYFAHYKDKARVLTSCILNEEISIKPGQKITKYVLLDSHQNGVDRAEAGVLNGLEFTVFNGDNTPRFNGTAQVSS